MTKTAYVITDGSHDEKLKIGGVAGKIVIEGIDDVIDFQLPIFNAYDSTVVEMIAIKEALSIVEKKKGSGIQVDHIVFATDSLDLICAIDPQQVRENHPKAIPFIARSARYQKQTSQVVNRIKSLGMTFDIEKVKAHVPEHEASVIESIHNKVDLMAKEPKDKVVSSLQPHNLSKGKYFSVLIPRDMSAETFKSVKKASYELIQKGFIPRVTIQAGALNPVNAAYDQLGDLIGHAKANKKRKAMRSYMAVEKDEAEPRLIAGLNKARARHWLSKEGIDCDRWMLNDFNGAVMNDIIMSTLGSSYPSRQIALPSYKGEYFAKCASFILHHGEEGLMPEHKEYLDRAVKTYAVERKLASSFAKKDQKKELENAFSTMDY